MSRQNLNFEAGEIIVLTKGEYSDFGISGFLVSLKKLDMKKLAQEYAVGKPVDSFEDGNGTPSGFMAWLVAHEYAAPVTYREVHISHYSDWEDDFEIETDDSDWENRKFKLKEASNDA